LKLNRQMRQGHAGRPARASRRGSREGGYVLLTLLLMVTVIALTLATILPDQIFELKRDREREMVHRGVQYTRAIQAYYRKFGRYPVRLEDLENTNNLRYLRKRYKDPENKNQDFKLLHFGEVHLSLSGGFGGGTIPGATPAGSAGLGGSGGSSSGFGGSGLGNSGFGNSGLGGSGVNSSGGLSQSSSFGGSSSGVFGSNSSSQTASQGTSPTATSDSSQISAQSGGSASDQVSPQGGSDLSKSTQQVFGGGPIIGVASYSKATTIREYNHKKKYNEWQFVYDPAADRGGLITTPYQIGLPSFGIQNQPSQTGQPGQPGTSASSPFGSGSFGSGSFGSSSFGTNSNSTPNSNLSNPGTPPPANPPQQQ
jgi:type II secretory pathway pseudopilin PulG